MTTSVVPTSFADIAVSDSAGAGSAVLMIHGNSSCKEVFRHQLESPLGARLRLIAMDLPGHGASSDARGRRMRGQSQLVTSAIGDRAVADLLTFGGAASFAEASALLDRSQPQSSCKTRRKVRNL